MEESEESEPSFHVPEPPVAPSSPEPMAPKRGKVQRRSITGSPIPPEIDAWGGTREGSPKLDVWGEEEEMDYSVYQQRVPMVERSTSMEGMPPVKKLPVLKNAMTSISDDTMVEFGLVRPRSEPLPGQAKAEPEKKKPKPKAKSAESKDDEEEHEIELDDLDERAAKKDKKASDAGEDKKKKKDKEKDRSPSPTPSVKSEEAKAEEAKAKEAKPKEAKPKEAKAKEEKAKEVKAKEAKSKEAQKVEEDKAKKKKKPPPKAQMSDDLPAIRSSQSVPDTKSMQLLAMEQKNEGC